jgi:DNA transformation protein
MPVSPSYKTFVLEQLRALGPVTAKPMFGGVGLYHEGVFFGLLADDTLYLKVDDGNRSDYEAAGMEPFRPYGDGSYSMHYYPLPADVLEDPGALREWAERAVAAARRKAAGKRKRPRP